MKSSTLFAADRSDESSLRDRVEDTVRQATHVAEEAQRMAALATDVVEDGIRSVRRGVKRSMHDIEDARDAAAYRIKRAPFKTVALAAAGGALAGALFACAAIYLTRWNRDVQDNTEG